MNTNTMMENLTRNSTDKEILDMIVGGMAIRDFPAISFLGWMAGKLNGVSAYKAANQELIGLISQPPISRVMPDLEKCRIIRQLLELDIEIK